MQITIRPYPRGESEDDYPDGMPGDDQTPDLVCTNCKAVYRFQGFKGKLERGKKKKSHVQVEGRGPERKR